MWKSVFSVRNTEKIIHKKFVVVVNKKWKSGKNKRFSLYCERMCVECVKQVEEFYCEKTLYK